ncbi:Uncharacterised protein [Escherichia coli]|nr:Uncharacterised protein [Escherichia coli]
MPPLFSTYAPANTEAEVREDNKIIALIFFIISPFFKRREAATHQDGNSGY